MAGQQQVNFYKSAAWQQARTMALMRDSYLCRMCGAPAEEVHHIIHLNPSNLMNPAVTLAQDNLICLCHLCHTAMHNDALAASGYGFDSNGMLIKLCDVHTRPIEK